MARRFRPDVRGFNEAMKLPTVGAALLEHGEAWAADAGEGFEAVLDTRHPWLDRVFVQPATAAARRANRRDQILMRVWGRQLG